MKGIIVVRGGGDIASGIVHRLTRTGYGVIILEVQQPTMVRRTVSYAQAIYDGKMTIEGVVGKLVDSPQQAMAIVDHKTVPILIDPEGKTIDEFSPLGVIDAILAKKNLGSHKTMAPIVIGVGPGFTAGEDVHAVVETQRGHYLGSVILQGQAIPDTGIPGEIGGYGRERVIRSPIQGIFTSIKNIGDVVGQGDLIAQVGQQPVYATISGVIRGMLQDGIEVTPGFKIGDIDPRAEVKHCFSISDKARSVGGGALEAFMYMMQDRRGEENC